MKTSKRILSLAIAVIMICALATSAMAVNITVDGDGDYVGYRILDLTTSTNTSGGTNYAYSVNEKYESILLAATGETTEAGIIDYISKLTALEAREFADTVYRAILLAGLAEDATAVDGLFSNEEQGYWLIADETEGEDRSLVMLDTAGQETMEVTPKMEVPTVEKKVLEDSTSIWGDVADYDIGDAVPFKLTATIPDISSFESYTITFHDTLSTGLTFDGETTISVKIGDTVATADDFDFDMATNSFSLTLSIPTTVAKGTVIEVLYTATLNELAKIFQESNPNEVYLEYSNNAYGAGTGITPKDDVLVYTYELDIFKFTVEGEGEDAEDVPLPGAEFKLFADVDLEIEINVSEVAGEDGVYVVDPDGDAVITSPEDGNIVIKGLDAGTYYLKETEAPEGFNPIADPIVIVISRDMTATDVDSVTYTVDEVVTDVVNVLNLTGTVLPSTGGYGTTIFYIVGGLLILGAAAMLIIKKKRSASAE